MFDMMIRYLKEDIIIKSKKENILKNLENFYKINCPYILTKEENEDSFMVCGINSCFANVDSIEKLKEVIAKVSR